jgi:RNA polymerase sigma-70 factor (ECF subfamily)
MGEDSDERSLRERSDDDLVLLARGHVSEAFDELVVRHQRALLRAADRYMGDPAAAADVVQNSLLELFNSLERYRPAGRFRAYLHRILLNQCRIAWRSRGRRHKREASFPPPDEPSRQPHDVVLESERQKELSWALARVATLYREPIVLRYGSELSYQEIADILELPVGTVKSRIFVGLEKLRRLLEEDR